MPATSAPPKSTRKIGQAHEEMRRRAMQPRTISRTSSANRPTDSRSFTFESITAKSSLGFFAGGALAAGLTYESSDAKVGIAALTAVTGAYLGAKPGGRHRSWLVIEVL